MEMNSFMPSMATMLLILVIFMAFMGLMLIVIFFVMQKRRVNTNLFLERGHGAHKMINIKGKMVWDEGSKKLKLFKLGVIDKRIPFPESNFFFSFKRKDTINLYLDKNGLIHKLRIPTMTEIKNFIGSHDAFKKILKDESINLEVRKKISAKRQEVVDSCANTDGRLDLFMIPEPHESLDYVIRQTQKGQLKYAQNFMAKWGWMAIPVTAMLVSMIMILFAMIFSQKMLG